MNVEDFCLAGQVTLRAFRALGKRVTGEEATGVRRGPAGPRQGR